MIWRVIKMALSILQVEVSYKEGDQLSIKIYFRDNIVFERIIDIIPKA